MPQYSSYPLITDPQPEDIVLIFQDSSGANKTVTVDNLADRIGQIIGAVIGAPASAKYLLNEPNAELTSAQSLSELGTGIMKSTTGTGIVSIASAGVDFVAPGVITSSGLTSITGVLLGRETAGTGAIEALTVLPTAIQDNITRLGTIISGAWNADPIDISVYVTGDLSVNNLAGGVNADATTFWRGDGTWATPAGGGGGSGDVVGPASSIAGNIAVFADTTGKLIEDSGVEAIESVSTSAGAADAGKLAVLDGAGQFDSSFIPSIASGEWLSTSTAPIAITAASTLTIGRWHICTGTTSDYTVTLPAAAGNTNAFIGIIMGSAATLDQLVTVDGNGSETIDGALSRVMWSNEVAVLRCNGTNWTKVAGKTIPMIAVMSLSSNQGSVVTATETKALIDTSNVDTTGRMVDIPNNRVNILRPSSYIVCSAIRWGSLSADAARLISFTRLNATPGNSIHVCEISALSGAIPSSGLPSPGTYAAGDFLELYGLQLSGVNQAFGGTGSTDATHLQVSEIISW